MKLLKLQKFLTIIIDLKFSIFLLILIALSSSIGSIIEQDESRAFYEENYPLSAFIDSKLIFALGIDQLYRSSWFLFLLLLLGISLSGCTITRQFPLVKNSKNYFFKKQENSFLNLPSFGKLKNFYFLQEILLVKISKKNFYIYHTDNFLYGYKGLIGRISPILVHLSLLCILGGSFLGSFQNFKAQEIIPKGEVFHIQNPVKVGWFTSIPSLTLRVNDFWVEYESGRSSIHQFYSNLSILDEYGEEIKEQTISVNNPLRYKTVDFYQSDWNLSGLRIKEGSKQIADYPLYLLNKESKIWITFINGKTIIIDELQDSFFLYDQNGKFLKKYHLNDYLPFQKNSSLENLYILEIFLSTGLLIKYDPSVQIIYLGFFGLMLTTLFSYFPYTQIWVAKNSKKSPLAFIWIGSLTNRGQVQIYFENFLRDLEKSKTILFWY